MTCSDSGKFICNVCGAECSRPVGALTREDASCSQCGSSMRVRALVALLSREIFGIELALPEFPVMKGIRGIGMSDSPEFAAGLAKKFDYTNTFYHQAPFFDVTKPDAGSQGRYDFILSSEVMEHIPPPVERGFETLCRATAARWRASAHDALHHRREDQGTFSGTAMRMHSLHLEARRFWSIAARTGPSRRSII